MAPLLSAFRCDLALPVPWKGARFSSFPRTRFQGSMNVEMASHRKPRWQVENGRVINSVDTNRFWFVRYTRWTTKTRAFVQPSIPVSHHPRKLTSTRTHPPFLISTNDLIDRRLLTYECAREGIRVSEPVLLLLPPFSSAKNTFGRSAYHEIASVQF